MILKVVDAGCGVGKTTAMINHINQDKDNNKFLYITPFLTEVERVKTACKDKNFQEMLNLLKNRSEDVRVTVFENKRAFKKADIEHHHVRFYEDYQEALDACWNCQNRVVVTGSLYFISEVRNYILNKKNPV